MVEETEKISKIGGVIVSHGQFAKELLAAAEEIVKEIPHVRAVSIGWHDDVEAARAEIERAIKDVSEGCGVLLLTDMFGGTPTNIASMFFAENEVEIVTGVNLPMVIKLASQKEKISLHELAKQIATIGRDGIYLAGDLLMPGKPKKSND